MNNKKLALSRIIQLERVDISNIQQSASSHVCINCPAIQWNRPAAIGIYLALCLHSPPPLQILSSC